MVNDRAEDIEIRPACEADLPQVAKLLGDLLNQEHEFEADYAKQLAGLKLIYGHPEVGCLLVIAERDQILGVANILYVPSTALGGRTAILDDLIIHPGRRGEHLGDRLFAAVIEHARAASCLRLTLHTDFDNQAAQKLYAKHGLMRSSMHIYKRELS